MLGALSRRLGFLLNRRKGFVALLSLKPRGLFISLPEQRNETKKFAGCRSRAKIFTFFLKKKNSLRSNSFFFFTEKSKNFFTLFHGGRKLMLNMENKRKTSYNNERRKVHQLIGCAMKSRSFTTLCSVLDDKEVNSRAKRCALQGGLLRPPWKSVKKNREFSVKNEKLFERSEFFLFSGNTCRSSPKSADGEFSLFRFFCSGKRNEKPLRLEQGLFMHSRTRFYYNGRAVAFFGFASARSW